MAERVTVVSTHDPWPLSTVTADDLEALVADGLLRPLSGDSQPEWMAPPSGAAPSPCHTRFWKVNRMRTMYVPGSELTYIAIT
jgi:hypothetical protein